MERQHSSAKWKMIHVNWNDTNPMKPDEPAQPRKPDAATHSPEADKQRELRAANVEWAESLGYSEASDQFKTQGCFSSGRTWNDDPEMSEAYDQGVNRAESEHQPSPLLARNICPHASVSFPDIDVRNLTKGQLVEEYAECNQQRQALAAHAQHLADALTTLFRECAMVHKYWGENCNQAQADAAVTKACEALAEWSKAQ